VLVLLLLFGALSDNVLDREKVLFDAPVLAYLHRIASPALDELMLFFTRTGDWRGVIPADCVIFAILLWRGRRHAATFWVFAVGGAALINLAAKAFLARTRPEPWLSMAPETTFSFPSGHAMGSMASVTALVILLWPTAWRWPAIVLGVLFVLGVGISRPYLGVHYPSDIVAG
jgi:membrane-associated phospholipid phosphatase